MKKSIQFVVVASALVACCLLVGCGAPETTPTGKSEVQKLREEMAAQLNAQNATIQALQKERDELKAVKPAQPVQGADLDSRVISNGIGTFHMPATLKKDEQQTNYVNVVGETAVKEVFRAREVQAHLCLVPPTYIQPGAPQFIAPQPAQMQQPPMVAPVAPIAPVPGAAPVAPPMQQPAPQVRPAPAPQPAPQGVPAGRQVMMVDQNGQLVPCNHRHPL